MKKINLLFTAILLLCCVGTVKAEEVTIDGIKYDVITKAKQAIVIKVGNYSGNFVIPSEITYNDVICSVTSIGSSAFSGCKGLTSVTIPNSVTSIGDRAFWGCSGLKSITIPSSVTSIERNAFSWCSGLTSITIPNSVTSIGIEAFSYCDGLKEVHINDLSAWCNISFDGYYANPLYDGAKLYLNGELVTDLVIPNSVTSIGNYAFYNCTWLTSVVIPNSVTRIGEMAFAGCSGLKSIEIPNSVTSIGSSAFSGCSGLTSIEIPNSVTSIGSSAFSGCSGLTSVTIGNSVTSIGEKAFYNCSRLTSVTIGSGVKSIKSNAFAKCENLANVYCLATSVPSTSTGAFNESYPEYMTLHVPAEAIDRYKTTAPWSNFGTIVTLDGESVVTPKCEKPTVLYSNGKLHFECETEGAEFVTEITSSDFNKFYNNDINLTATYNICVYATATGYENSETVNAILCWIENGENDENNNVINIPAKAVLVTSNNGTINITCSLEGESVELYTSDAMFIESTTIENGCATIESGLSKGDIAIVKIGEKSIKIIID